MAWMLAALVAVLTTAACGSSTDTNTCNTASPIYATVQGTWAGCAPASATTSMKNTITVSGCGVTITNDVYTSSLVCAGTPIRAAAGTGTIAIGSALANTAFNTGAAAVTAYQLDVIGTLTPTGGSPTSLAMYTIAYVNSATPANLFMGDTSGANDGTTAAKRPTVLDGYYPFTKQ
jgi:hypothetical protein